MASEVNEAKAPAGRRLSLLPPMPDFEDDGDDDDDEDDDARTVHSEKSTGSASHKPESGQSSDDDDDSLPTPPAPPLEPLYENHLKRASLLLQETGGPDRDTSLGRDLSNLLSQMDQISGDLENELRHN